jgi:hypothetical protein
MISAARHAAVSQRTSHSMNLRLRIAFFLLLSMFAPGAGTHAAPAVASALRAGAAASNITPALGVSLQGVVAQGSPAIHVHDELYARCLVLDDGVERIAIVVCDSTMIAGFVVDEAKEIIRRRSGLSPDRVLISATHTHSTPRAIKLSERAEDLEYLHFLARRIADAVQRAINHLAPAKVGWARGRRPEFVHNRRWFVEESRRQSNPFGGTGDLVTMNPNRAAGGLLRPAGPVDPEIFVLSVQHADGRPLALLANFGLHYVGGIPGGVVSADYFGVFAERMRALLGASGAPDGARPQFVAMMSNGTSGDVNAIDFSAPDQPAPPYARMTAVAHAVAEEAFRAYKSINHRADVPLIMREVTLPVRVRKPDAQRLAWAEPIYAAARAKIAAGRVLTRPEVFAREAIYLKDYPDVAPVTLQAIRIGDLGIVSAPSEIFAETGLAIKAQSALPATFTISLANGFYGYLPTSQQHTWGGYETWDARSSALEIEAEPKIRAALLGLLEELSAKPSAVERPRTDRRKNITK